MGGASVPHRAVRAFSVGAEEQVLPSSPDGDVEPAVDILTTRDALRAVDERLAQHVEIRPELGTSPFDGARAQDRFSLADDPSQVPPDSGVAVLATADPVASGLQALVGGPRGGDELHLDVNRRKPFRKRTKLISTPTGVVAYP
jgi:hypothetical protein